MAKIKHALKNSIIITENSESGLNTSIVNIEEKKSEVIESLQNENDIKFIAFGRIYSGTIRRGQDVYVLGPKYDPSKTIDKVCYVEYINLKYFYIVFSKMLLFYNKVWFICQIIKTFKILYSFDYLWLKSC